METQLDDHQFLARPEYSEILLTIVGKDFAVVSVTLLFLAFVIRSLSNFLAFYLNICLVSINGMPKMLESWSFLSTAESYMIVLTKVGSLRHVLLFSIFSQSFLSSSVENSRLTPFVLLAVIRNQTHSHLQVHRLRLPYY